mmetsp:Transcript_62238/g.146742  ORF Transcript_62238/g.146742 Transcript_62238/m.146742 type:complete len:214 (+) Transcript_62238:1634-2275(+)
MTASGSVWNEICAPLSSSSRWIVRPPTPMREPCSTASTGTRSSSSSDSSLVTMSSTFLRASADPVTVIRGSGSCCSLTSAPVLSSSWWILAPLGPMRRRKLRIPDFCAPLSLSPTSSASRNVSLPTAFWLYSVRSLLACSCWSGMPRISNTIASLTLRSVSLTTVMLLPVCDSISFNAAARPARSWRAERSLSWRMRGDSWRFMSSEMPAQAF